MVLFSVRDIVLVMRKSACILSLFFFFIISDLFPQEITGNIEGYVKDSLGNPIESVNVTAESNVLQGLKGTATNSRGLFRIHSLPPGDYTVRISSIGYNILVFKEVKVFISRTLNLGNIILKQSAIDLPEINVAAARSRIDASSTTYGGSISFEDFEQLPVDRNYTSIVTLFPMANTSYFGDGPNISGSTGFENKYFVDGFEVTDPWAGAKGTNLPYNFIREVEVKSGGYDAGIRSSLGGLLNVVTHTGSNEFHGSAFGFYTSNRFSENPKAGLLDIHSGDFSDYDVGFGIGGPILRDRLWFYTAYNPTFSDREVEVPGFDLYADRNTMHAFAAKLNWKANNDLSIVFTTTGDPSERKAVAYNILNPPNRLLNPDPYLLDLVEGGINLSLKADYTLSSSVLLEAAVAKTNRQFSGEPSTERGRDELFFDNRLDSIWSGGGWHTWDTYRYTTTAKLSSSIGFGSHLLEAGIEYRLNEVEGEETVHRLFYDTSSYSDYFYYYGELIDNHGGYLNNKIPSFYIQDKWRIIDQLSLSFGFRWDRSFIYDTNGKLAQRVAGTFQPRAGFVFVTNKEGDQRVFGSYGRFSQELSLSNSFYFNGNGFIKLIYRNFDPRFDGSGWEYVQLDEPYKIMPEVPDLKGQYYDEFSLGFESLIGWDIKAGIQGIYRTLRESIENVYLKSDMGNYWTFGNPGTGQLSAWPRAKRDYTALVVNIERRGADNLSYTLSYTLSRQYGNYQGLFDPLYHSINPNVSVTFDDLEHSRYNATGLLPNDRTHVFKFSGYYSFPFGFTAGLFFTAQSGTPLSKYTYNWFDKGITFISPRGSEGKTPAIWDLNARLIYKFDLSSFNYTKLIIDVLNIASQRKPVDISQQYFQIDSWSVLKYNKNYGKAYRYQPPMSVRLGLEVGF